MEKKKYNLGYNRYMNQVIVYSTPQDAERGGGWWKVIETYTLEEAKRQLLIEYREAHTENE